MKLCEAYAALCEFAHAKGLRSIKDTPGLVSLRIDDQWEARFNPHRETVENVPPFNVAVEFNGWPAGIVGPDGGVIAAGSVANEEALLEALRRDGGPDEPH